VSRVIEGGLRAGFSPNVYIEKIILSPGSAITSRTDNAVDRSARIIEYRRPDGTQVYQPRTSIEDSNVGTTSVELHLQLKDVLRPGATGGSWIGNSSGRRRTMVYIIQSLNPSLTRDLINGNHLDSYPLSLPQNYNRLTDYDIKEISLAPSEGGESLRRHQNGSGGNTILSLDKRANFVIPQDTPAHLTYFVMAVQDNSNNPSQRASVHSMILVERVYHNSTLMNSTSIYRNQDGDIWPGPVHQHPDSGWMEGAFHSSQPHDTLTKISAHNFKIQDKRVFSEINDYRLSLEAPASNNNVFISEPQISKSRDGAASLVFSLDHLNYMISASKFGKLYLESSPRLQEQLLQQSRIMQLTLSRKRVVKVLQDNRIGSVNEGAATYPSEDPAQVFALSGDQLGILEPRARYVIQGPDYNNFTDQSLSAPAPTSQNFYGSVEELSINRIGNLRTFKAVDGELSRITSGDYQYHVSIRFKDAAFSYLQGKLANLNKTINVMTSYLAEAERPSNYNRASDRFSSSFASQQSFASNRYPAWAVSILIFADALDLLTDIDSAQKLSLVRRLYSLVNPSTGTMDNLRAFITCMENFSNKFENLISPSRIAHTEDRSNLHQTSKETFLDMNKSFSTIVSANSVAASFDFLGMNLANQRGAPVVTPSQYMARIDRELQRYEGDTYQTAELVSEFSFITPQDASALASSATRYSYAAPAFFRAGTTTVDLLSEDKDEFDSSSVSAIIQQAIAIPTVRDIDFVLDRDVLGLLRQAGTGPTSNRMSALSNAYAAVAESTGISLGPSLIQPIASSLAAQSSNGDVRDSVEYVGRDLEFAAAPSTTPPTTTRAIQPDFTNALSVMGELFRPPTAQMRNTGSLSADSLNTISFDLSRSDNFINKRIRANAQSEALRDAASVVTSTLQNLPTQIKLLTRSRSRVYNSDSSRLSAGTDAQTNQFIYNFSMLRAVEYLDGYEDGNLKRPIWRRVDAQILSLNNVSLLCRFRRYFDPNVNIGVFEEINRVPVSDETFILSNNTAAATSAGSTLSQLPALEISSIESGISRTSLTSGPQRDVAIRLGALGVQQRNVEGYYEYLSSAVPGAPTGLRGRISGIPARRRTPMASRPATPSSTTGGTSGGQGY